MPLYEYRCPECRELFHEHVPLSERDVEFGCPDCRVPLNRVFGFNYHSSLRDGYCVATGSYVRNEHDLKEQFKQMSEDYSKKTGLPADFQPIHPREIHGLTMDGMEDTFRATGQGNTAEVEKIITTSPQSSSKPRKPVRRNYTGGWETPTKVN